jgi:hypothetical protein
MIDYFFKVIFHRKKIIVLHLCILLYGLILGLVYHDMGNIYERMLFQEAFMFYQREAIKPILLYSMWFFLLILTIDHENLYHALLYPYFKRLKMDVFKLLSYFLSFSYFFLLMILLTEVYFILYFDTWMFSPKIWLMYYLDGTISLLIYLSFIQNRTKTLSLIIPINLFVIHLFISDQSSLVLYYLFPIFHPFDDIYLLAIFYKLWYITSWFLLYGLKSMTKRIYA